MLKRKRPPGKGGRIDHHTQPIITGDSYSSLAHPPPQLIEPRDCLRFDRCSANVCPLDPDWQLRQHLEGESICVFLRAAVKPGGVANLRGVISQKLAKQVLQVLPSILSRYGSLRRALKRAAKRPCRLGRRVGVPRPRKAA